MAGELKLIGAVQLNAALRDLGAEVATRLGENSVRAGARVVATEAKNRAPVGATGNLKKSIRAFRDTERRSGERRAFAGTRLFYAKFVEFGTVHMSAKQFLRPAIDEGGQKAVDKMTENLRAGINRVAVKHGGKADGPTSAASDLDIYMLGVELGAGL